MPVFTILVILAVVLVWFLLAFAFKPLGGLVKRLFDDAVEAMEDEDTENTNN